MSSQNLNSQRITKEFRIPDHMTLNIFGYQDKNLKVIKSTFNIEASYVGGCIEIVGEPKAVEGSIMVLEYLISIQKYRYINMDDIITAVRFVENNETPFINEFELNRIKVAGIIKSVMPKSLNQLDYFKNMRDKDLVFAYGPAGTGKTFLAVAMAVNFYLEKKVNRIILTRPAVEAGEKLGFLPGDLAEKVNPYLRPIYDALYSMLDYEVVLKLLENNVIEVIPLAFMRGRTLSSSFVILDEAQNTTPAQMKMFLTRLGFGSKAIVTGDITQIDLAKEVGSGLITALKILKDINDIGFVHLTDKDVIRHPLVNKIVLAYNNAESK